MDANGSATPRIWAAGPTLTFVLGPDGEIVLAGFLASDTTSLSTRSTAQALLYVATAGFALPPELVGDALEALARQPACDQFTTDLDAALAGGAADLGAIDVVQQLRNAVATIVTAGAASQSITVDPGPRDRRSGLTMEGAHGQTEVATVTNYFRRRVTAFTRSTGYTPASGQGFTPLEGAWRMDRISPVDGFTSVIGSALRLWRGQGLFNLASKNVPAPLAPADAKATRYETVVVVFTPEPDAIGYTLVGENGFDPDFYGSSITSGNWQTTLNCDGTEIPLHHFFLSGSYYNPESHDSGAVVSWHLSRFSDFIWTIQVHYPN